MKAYKETITFLNYRQGPLLLITLGTSMTVISKRGRVRVNKKKKIPRGTRSIYIETFQRIDGFYSPQNMRTKMGLNKVYRMEKKKIFSDTTNKTN